LAVQVAAVLGGKATILGNADGGAVTPSVVSFLGPHATPRSAVRQCGVLVGEQALRMQVITPHSNTHMHMHTCTHAHMHAHMHVHALHTCTHAHAQVINPHSTYASTKRLIGRTASEAELRSLAALDVPATADGKAGGVLLPCPALRTTLSPVDVAAELISSLRSQAEEQLVKP
tara:strand:+ start:300 stop:821 length:522 start_codon:yes stop_codon:yes gene_type:complete